MIRPILILACLLLAGATAPAGAAEDAAEKDGERTVADTAVLRLSLDPDFTFETGADLTYAATYVLGELEARYISSFERRPAAGIPLRLVRTVLLDHPLAYWFVVLQHEAFGHGGRAREFGSSASFHMGSPWQGRSSYATFSTRGLSTEQLLHVFTGGSESNGWGATLLERELVAGRSMRSFELLYLLRSRLVASDYVLRTTPDPVSDPAGFFAEWDGGGDVAHYLGYLNTIHHGEPGITPGEVSPTVVREYRRLERQARWNALDPGVWISLWSVGQGILRGDRAVAPPLPRIRGRRFLPVLSAEWLPDGGTESLELILGPAPGSTAGPRWTAFTARRGNGPAGTFGAVGAATEKLWQTPRLRVGGEVELWRRADGDLGGGLRARFRVTRGRLRDFFLDVGVKSDGAWPGRPVPSGVFFRLGGFLGPLNRFSRDEPDDATGGVAALDLPQ